MHSSATGTEILRICVNPSSLNRYFRSAQAPVTRLLRRLPLASAHAGTRVILAAKVISHHPVAPERLGQVERAVAVAQQVFGRISVVRKHRNSHRQGAAEF